MSTMLNGQTAIISGGLGDIGFAIARELASHGADIALGDIKPPAAAKARLAELMALGRRSCYDQVDVSDAERVADWVRRVADAFGTPTLIVPNAAVVEPSPICDVTPALWQSHLNVNLTGSFVLAQACASALIAAKKPGRVAFIGSWAASAPHIHLAAYCVSKAALRMLCKTMAIELAPNGIFVNEIAPGYVDAGLTAEIWSKDPASREKGRLNVPTQELISADEVAFQVAHVFDPRNRHMTGTTVTMDGGLSLTSAATLQHEAGCRIKK